MSSSKSQKQHFVPKVYLKAFCDPSRPPNWPRGRPFSPSVWLLDPPLRKEPRRKSPNKILLRPGLYTLAHEGDTESSIEAALSKLETEYAHAVKKTLAREPLSERDLITLTVFIGALHGRTPGMMEHRQGQIDAIEHLYRQVERGATGSEVGADEFWRGSEEAGKRLILRGAGSYARVIAPRAWILVNKSPMPLVTSDNPVIHEFVHVDELRSHGFPSDRLRSDALPNERAFLSITPLSPELALVSSPLFVPPNESVYGEASDIRAVVAMNEWTRGRAGAVLISKYRNPYGPIREVAIALDRQAKALPPPSGLQIYTERGRHWIPSENIVHGHGSHPLVGRLEFRTGDMEALCAAAAEGDLQEINIYEAGKQSGGMRNARFIVVAAHEGETSVIEMVL
jgi:hypothetical protein